MALTSTHSQDELQQAREKLLIDAGYSYEEFKRRAEMYTLTETERAAWETIQNIDFLLTDDED